jgi:hypothetical protein
MEFRTALPVVIGGGLSLPWDLLPEAGRMPPDYGIILWMKQAGCDYILMVKYLKIK